MPLLFSNSFQRSDPGRALFGTPDMSKYSLSMKDSRLSIHSKNTSSKMDKIDLLAKV